ncbi:hypothetical protein ATO6_16880 [Oceanicola sp. 22II-s10i]|uniref:YIP1 family protein n=1 Tax=Oceanicola sp. 22II-s10i TaxID=1317116 RepID=UPI000B52782C|nr:YIP1 family protein [Oceanicola sp. 22II-s10i]OWU83555.1 hypothetical protein ATO6_16880 [Oceanicola sp. 22II-s10i]
MSALKDMAATYRGPGGAIRRILSRGVREDRALVVVMAACLLIFVAQLPRLARQAHMTGEDLNPLMGASLFAWLFIAPLLLYGVGAVVHLLARVAGGRGTFYGARMALFWSLLSSAPVLLLHGLVAGFIGPGPQLALVGAVWLALFLWFWIAGTIAAEKGETA